MATWWEGLTLSGQMAVWLAGTILGMTVLLILGHLVKEVLNKYTTSTLYEPYKNPVKWIVLFSMAISMVALMSIVGLPSAFVMPVGGVVAASVAVVIGPWLRDSAFLDNAAVWRATFDWRRETSEGAKGDWIASADGSAEGYWLGANMSYADLRHPAGKVCHYPLKTFRATPWVNHNQRSHQNPLGLMRVDVAFPFTPNGPINKARQVLEKVADKTPGIVIDKGEGVDISFFDDIDADSHRIVARYWVRSHDDEISTKAFMYREGADRLAHNDIMLYNRQRYDWVQTTAHKPSAKAVEVTGLADVAHQSLGEIQAIEMQRQQPVMVPVQQVAPEPQAQPPVQQQQYIQQPQQVDPAQTGILGQLSDMVSGKGTGKAVPAQEQVPVTDPNQPDAQPVNVPVSDPVTGTPLADGESIDGDWIWHDGKAVRRVGSA